MNKTLRFNGQIINPSDGAKLEQYNTETQQWEPFQAEDSSHLSTIGQVNTNINKSVNTSNNNSNNLIISLLNSLDLKVVYIFSTQVKRVIDL